MNIWLENRQDEKLGFRSHNMHDFPLPGDEHLTKGYPELGLVAVAQNADEAGAHG